MRIVNYFNQSSQQDKQVFFLKNCTQGHCFDLSGLFSAFGDRREARGF